MTMHAVRTMLFAFPIAILAQNPVAEFGWLPSLTQGGAFAALVFVLWWILTRQQPAEKAAFLKTIEALLEGNAIARQLYADQSDKMREKFASENLLLRQAFAEEIKHYRDEGRARENELTIKLITKEEQMIAMLQGKLIPSSPEPGK